MRTRRHTVQDRVAVLSTALLGLTALPAHAQELWWDPNGTTPGIGGSGTWNTTVPQWAPNASGTLPTLIWTNSGTATATFTGTPGTVTTSGTINAAGLSILTSGYRFTGELRLGSTPASPGFINLASGITATFSGKLVPAAGTNNLIRLSGAGRLIFDSADVTTASLQVRDNASLRITNANALRDGDLDIKALARADFGSLATASLGSLLVANAGTLDLGSTALTLRQTTTFPTGVGGSLTSTATGGLTVTRPPSPAQDVGDLLFASATTRLGFLDLQDGVTVTFSAGTTNLVSTFQQPSGRPSLTLRETTRVVLTNQSAANLSGFPELRARTQLTVQAGSNLSILGPTSVFHIGSTGDAAASLALVEVFGSNSRISADNAILLGTPATTNPGIGELRITQSGRVTARSLTMHSTSLLDLQTNATLELETLQNTSSNIRIGESASITLTGNTTHTFGGTLQNNLTGLGGLLHATAGTLLFPQDLAFNGTVRIGPAATLRPTRTALQFATVHLDPGATLDLSNAPGTDPLRLGGLAGSGDLTLTTRALEVGAGNRSATYAARLIASEGLRKFGTGTQTFTGGTTAQPISLRFLTVNSGEVRLSAAHITLTETNNTSAGEAPLRVDGPQSRLVLEAGTALTTPNRPKIANGATLEITGPGTSFSVTAPPGTPTSIHIGVGPSSGHLVVSDGATLDVTNLLIGAAGAGPANLTSATFATGGQLSRPIIFQFEGPQSQLIVDRSVIRAITLFHFNPDGAGILRVSDPLDGTPGLTVGVPGNSFQGSVFRGSLADGPSGPGSIAFNSPTGILWEPATNTFSGRIVLQSGPMTINRANVFAPNILHLTFDNPLVTAGIPNIASQILSIGHLEGPGNLDVTPFSRLNLGRSNQTVPADPYTGTLTLRPDQPLWKVGTSSQTLLNTSLTAASLYVVTGNLHLQNTHVTTSATGSTGFGGDSSLFIEGGGSLLLSQGATLTTVANVQVHNTGSLSLASASTLHVNRASPDLPGFFFLGLAGGLATASLSNPGTTLSAADRILLGFVFPPNPGSGRITATDHALLTAPSLFFGSSDSSLILQFNATARFAHIATHSNTTRPTLQFAGGSLELVRPDQYPTDSPFAPPTSIYTGQITGTGTFRTHLQRLELTQPPNFTGSLHVENNATLRISPPPEPPTTPSPTTLHLHDNARLELGLHTARTLALNNLILGPNATLPIDLDFLAPANVNHDRFLLTGLLILQSTPAQPATLQLTSLASDNTPGVPLHFNPGAPLVLNLFDAAAGALNYAPNLLHIDTSAFNAPFAGTFSTRLQGTRLQLIYTPGVIPEPAALSLLLLPALTLTRPKRQRQPRLPDPVNASLQKR